jgi:hypothetical protein
MCSFPLFLSLALLYFVTIQLLSLPITVTARSKTRTVFDYLNTGIVGSNPTRGMNVCVHLFCVCVVLCVGSDLATG